MSKRIIVILLAAVLVFGGCSSKTEDQRNTDITGTVVDDNKATPQPTEQPTVEPTVLPTAEPTSGQTEEESNATEENNQNDEQPTADPTEQPTVEPTAEPTIQPTVEPTVEPTAEPTAEPTVEPTAGPTAEPTEQPVPTPSEDIPDDFYGYYKIISISTDGEEVSGEYFDILEKYGIYMATMIISEEGQAEFNFGMDPENTEIYSFDGTTFKQIDDDLELLYVYKDGVLTVLAADILGNVKVEFVKMTEAEIEAYKKGFPEENLEPAMKEIEALLSSDEQFKDNEYANYVEKSRRANDALNYQALYECAQIALVTDEVTDMLKAGHSYRIIMDKERARILVDGIEAGADDPLLKLVNNYAGEDFGSW